MRSVVSALWQRAPVTFSTLALCIIVYLLMHVFGDARIARPLLISEFTSPQLPEIRRGEIWRLLTPAFLHFGLFHIVFNLAWVAQLGGIIEMREGRARLLALMLIAALVSNLAQYFGAGPLFGGMSGVVYALLAYVWLQSRNPRFGVVLPPAIFYFMLGWFALGLSGALSLVGIHIANWAHSGGLVTGMLFGLARRR